MGDLGQAHDLTSETLQRVEDLDHAQLRLFALARVCNAQASVKLRTGDPECALETVWTVLAEHRHQPHDDTLEAVDLAAVAFALQGSAELAARLKGAVDSECHDCGLVIQPPDAPLREAATQHAQSVYAGDWEAAVTEGRATTLDEGVELARVEASRVGEAQAGVGLEDQ